MKTESQKPEVPPDARITYPAGIIALDRRPPAPHPALRAFLWSEPAPENKDEKA